MGFRLVDQQCMDIDECKEFRSFCFENNHCTNTVGSYFCGCWHGYKSVGTGCSDINECIIDDVCPTNSVCQNNVGNYKCECDTGFQGYLCEDTDECSLSSSCHANATCTNSDGSFMCFCNEGYHGDGKTCREGDCDDRRCPTNQKCISSTTKECKCVDGFISGGKFCEDIDECVSNNDCDQNSNCTNLEGSYTCTCDLGYIGDGKRCRKGTCSDDMCPLNEECVSSETIQCRCKSGFERNEANFCQDIDECITHQDKCDLNADCLSTDGSYECYCKENFFGTGQICFSGSCSDLNCPSSDNKKCVSPTTVDCKCIEGTELDDSLACIDNDECATNTHDCGQDDLCFNTAGSFLCSPPILLLSSDQEDDRGRNGDPIYTSDARIINGFNGQAKKIEFEFESRTEVTESCSIVWHGKMHLFGGLNQQRQISVVDECKLRRIGDLHFDMKDGACAQRQNSEIFICFEHELIGATYRNCRRAIGPLENFEKLSNSQHDHGQTRIAVTSGKIKSTAKY